MTNLHLTPLERLEELEWHLLREVDPQIRAAKIHEYHDLWESIHGAGNISEGSSSDSSVPDLRQDLRSSAA